jgi:chorismate mutase
MDNLSEKIKNTDRPFVIAGPCSVETEKQTHTIISALAEEGKTHLIRAGIWKPRTRPDSFEGIGEEGLSWLKEASKNVNLPFSVEVANAKHVEIALNYQPDVLWIGARTTVNPFAVQEIADSLKGVKIPVMVKNPVNPDLNLWIGAFERLQQAGINDLVAIHRGFSVYNHEVYRNVPNWEIPIALKQELPTVPLICDPSHISGRTDLLLEVSQKAMDLNYAGLMIETHPTPEKAWSDAKQQITAKDLTQLLSNLVLRSKQCEDFTSDELEVFRKKVGDLDTSIFTLLSERMKVSEAIGQFKKENNITILQEEHWKKLLNSRLQLANQMDLSTEFVRSILDAIHLESITRQINVMNKK